MIRVSGKRGDGHSMAMKSVVSMQREEDRGLWLRGRGRHGRPIILSSKPESSLFLHGMMTMPHPLSAETLKGKGEGGHGHSNIPTKDTGRTLGFTGPGGGNAIPWPCNHWLKLPMFPKE